ncbi:MAG: transcription termination/antitermination protein NusG [Candidatus Malacoplasma girerdii]|nr:MAG: transcription termination/antitermination protein NusG [Candidatus Malacoplasma girerdii]
MKQQNNDLFQWFIITVIGGKEDSIIQTLKEKIVNFSYEEYVKEIKVFKTKVVKEEIFEKTSAALPKTMRNTKTIQWTTLPNGSYKKTTQRITNKFPGYVFINMLMDPQVWYCIRNTNGVLGFVGSSGKGAMPIPISIVEYEQVTAPNNTDVNDTTNESLINSETNEQENTTSSENTETMKVVYECPFVVGNTVRIASGAFEGESGEIKSLDNSKGTAIVQIEVFGRSTNVELPYDQLKIDD